MQKLTLIGAYLLLLVIPTFAQDTTAPAGAKPKDPQAAGGSAHAYEIVSIKPSKPGSNSGGMQHLPDGFAWINIPLSLLVLGSYGMIMDSQVSGLPDWAKSDRYDIVAKADSDTTEKWKLSRKERWKEEQLMMQSILADRCQFKAHQETRELPVYDLVIAKGGLKMKDAPSDETPTERMGGGQMTVHAMAVDTIVAGFAGTDGRMIVDKTGLGNKKFDFELKWTPDNQRTADDAAPSFFTALEEQLGLKLVPAKAPVEVLTIDHMERPSPN